MLRDPDYGFCTDESVTFKVEITVYGELEVANVPLCNEKLTQTKNSSLEHCLYQLWIDKTLADITFVVGPTEERIAAHKCVLMARTPVFYAMFSYDMHEQVYGEVRVPDFEPEVIREMLHFIYTDTRSDTAANNNNTFSNTISNKSSSNNEVSVEALFRAAAKYQIPGLLAICEQHFVAQMDDESAVSLLQMADTYGAQHLKLKCLQYIAHNSSKIVQRREFGELEEELLGDANRLIEAVNKRKGCGNSSRGSAERERRFNSSCIIM